MTNTPSEKILMSLVTFKGACNGCTVQFVFPTYFDIIYLCQANAWMDEEEVIAAGVKSVVCLFVQTFAKLITVALQTTKSKEDIK